ncbi:MAG: fasciclin domain-containing protein [Candidatus Bathyarchaeia archaeon]
MPKLIEVLKYHVVEGVYCLADAFKIGKLKTLQGKELKLDLETCSVNGAEMLEGDIVADNGVIHVIDTVLTIKAKTPLLLPLNLPIFSHFSIPPSMTLKTGFGSMFLGLNFFNSSKYCLSRISSFLSRW